MNTELIAESRSHADSLRVVMQDQAAETIESLCSALEALQAEVARLKKLSVTNIMLAIVPGDGSGFEVYAKSVAEVAQKLSDMGGELEDWQLGIKRHHMLQEIIDKRDAALARLAITEEANSMLLARNKWLEHTLEVAGASPVEPSQALELSQQEAEALAHRRASKYAHRSDSSYVAYTFLPHTLMDFVRDVTAAINAKGTPQAAAQPSQAESDLRGIDAGPLSEWVDLRLRGYVSKDECLIAVKDIPKWVAQNGARLAAINAKGTPQAAAQPPAPGEAAREYMTGYSDCREWAQPDHSELVKDAARYRWIRLGKPYRVVVDAPTKKKPDAKITIMVSPSPESDYARALDAAIDAVINAKEQPNG